MATAASRADRSLPTIPQHAVAERGWPLALLDLEQARAEELLEAAGRLVPRPLIAIGDRLSRRWLLRSGNRYLAEIDAIGHRLGQPGACFLNVSYEWGCTSRSGASPNGGGAQFYLWWKKVAAATYTDWKGEYWANRDLSGQPSLVRNGTTVDFSWGTGAAAAGLPKDNFSARWTRQVTFSRGVYRLYAWADDGIRVRVGDQVVLNEWHTAGNEVYTVDLPLDGARRVTVEYYEQGGEARVRFWWKRIGDL